MQYSLPAPRLASPPRVARWSQSTVGRFIRNKSNAAGVAILGPVLLLAMLAPVLPLPDPLETDIIASLEAPSLAHLFGTDKLGRDIFSRTLSGLQVSLVVGFASAAISMTVGVVVGTIAGTMGKTTDAIISALVDVFLAFPSLLLAIGVIAVFGSGLPQLIAALSISSMPGAVRLQRSMALGLRSRTFMDAARMANAPMWWLLVRHVVPNTVAPMVVVATIYAANAILAEAALSFLGLGIVPPAPSLGNLVADGRNYLQTAWWISTMPGIALALVAMSLHLFSDGIREQLDPQHRT